MLRLLANRLLKKIAGRLESGTQTGKMKMMKKMMNMSGEPKETAVSRKIMPADGSPSAMNGEFGTSPVPIVSSLSLTDGRGKE